MKNSTATPQDDVQGPAIVSADHVQDRIISPVAGARRGYRRRDGLAWMESDKVIAGYQVAAGRRLQEDYELSQMRGGAQSNNGERTNGNCRSWDIPDSALDAEKRVNEARSILVPEIDTMLMLFLLPDHKQETLTLEEISKRTGEHKRAITLGIRIALSLLARHYG